MKFRLSPITWGLIAVVLAFLIHSIFPQNRWMFDATECRASGGFCWAFIRAKIDFLIFGFYPREALWRPGLWLMIVIGMGIQAIRPVRWNKMLALMYLLCLASFPVLMSGFGSEMISVEKWGGLPLSLFLILASIVPGFILALLLALARRSTMPLFRIVATVVIEFTRGVPLISLLFMASLLWPYFFPPEWTTPKLVRALLVLSIFVAAYMAEVIRGGLQGVPKGQYEALKSLGFTFWQGMRLVIFPQAISHIVIPLANTVVGMCKDTSLVMIIALFDLTGTVKASLADQDWPGFSFEAYLFAALVYYILCRFITWLGRQWQIQLQQGKNS